MNLFRCTMYVIVGNEIMINNMNDNDQGLAYDARMVLMDLEDSDGYFWTPKDLYNDYLDFLYVLLSNESIDFRLIPSYKLGIKIVSSSWGSLGLYDYNYICYDVDKYIWENNDLVAVFAAGNYGEEGYE